MTKKVPRAGDIMDRDAVVLAPSDSVRDAAVLLAKRGQLNAPVIDDSGRILGTFSQQGCLEALLDVVYDEQPVASVDQYLKPAGPTITPSTSLVDIAQIFVESESGIPSLVVVEDDQVVGLVSRLDMIRGVLEYMAPAADVAVRTLYLSALREEDEKPGF